MSPMEIKSIKSKHDGIIKELDKLYKIYKNTKSEKIKISIAERIRELLKNKKEIDEYLLNSVRELQDDENVLEDS